jgi:hypothetical protein
VGANNKRTDKATQWADPINFILPNIFWVIRSKRFSWAGYYVRNGETKNLHKLLFDNPGRKRCLVAL